MKKMIQFMAVSCGLALATSCVSRADIDEIKKTQKDILAKLNKAGAARPAAPAARPGRPDPTKSYAFPVGESATKGSKDAWVTIVEVSDFQCPFCNRVNPTMKQITSKYGKDVRIAFKHNPLPFHKRALPAAMAAECAGEQNKFWSMHDRLFENQRALEDADLEKYAKTIGVNVAKWKACFKSNKYNSRIKADQATAHTLGARGTPAFFINGRFLSGAQPLPAFEKLIDEELKKAKSSGIAKNDYYNKQVIAKGAKKI